MATVATKKVEVNWVVIIVVVVRLPFQRYSMFWWGWKRSCRATSMGKRSICGSEMISECVAMTGPDSRFLGVQVPISVWLTASYASIAMWRAAKGTETRC